MGKRISLFLFSFFSLFVIFSDEFFYSFMSIMGISLESGLKSREAIVIAGITYFIMIIDLTKERINRQNRRQLLALFAILVLYLITGFMYPHTVVYQKYTAQLLAYGALSIPAAYVGMRLARGGYGEYILKLLPFFLVFVSLTVGYAIVTSSIQGVMLGHEEEDVFNYQNASYYLSFCAAYCVFYVFFNNNNHKTLFESIEYIVVLLLIFLCSIGCILGGGRGAFVYLVAISAYLAFRIISRRKKGKLKYILLLFGAALVMVFLAIRFQIFESVGASRVAESLTSDDARSTLWNTAMNSFKESPIVGHGIGSIWWEVGFYSHNILADLLVETGVIGASIVVIVLAKMVFCMIRRSKLSNLDMFLMLVFFGCLLKNSFSGYWMSSFNLFLIFGYVFGLSKRERKGLI